MKWNEPEDLDGLSYHVLNILHVTAEGVAWQHEARLNATTTSVLLPQLRLAPLEGAPALVLTKGMRVSTRFRSVYLQGTTKILAPRLRASPAFIFLRDVPQQPEAVTACGFQVGSYASGLCAPLAYACSEAPAGEQKFTSFHAFNTSLTKAPWSECGSWCNNSCIEACTTQSHNRTSSTCCSYKCASNARCSCAEVEPLDSCRYAGTHTHTYTLTLTHSCTHAHTHTHTRTHTRLYMYVYMYMQVYMCIYVYIYVYMCMRCHKYITTNLI